MVRSWRKRYILFRSSPVLDRATIISALKGIEGRPWLISFDGKEGIVRCKHTDKDGVIAALISLNIEPVATSGTIKGAKKYIRKREHW